MGFEPTHTGATTLGLNRLTIPTIQCSSFFRATASSVSLRLSHILRYAPSSSLTIPCISKKILRIQHLFSELLRHSFHSCSVTYLSMLLRIHSAFLVSRKNTSHSASFFRAAASQLSLMLSHILKYAPSHSLSVPCISKKILRIQCLFPELLRHSFLPGCGQEDVPVFQLGKLATENGLEPSTSSVTGWHSNQLNYSAIK